MKYMKIYKFYAICAVFLLFASCSSTDNVEEVIDEMEEVDETTDNNDTTDPTDDSTTGDDNTDTTDDSPVDEITGLKTNVAPSENFDLSTWKIQVPEFDTDGFSLDVSVSNLNNGYESSDYFYTGDDGGMVFECPVFGAKTSANTSYTRSELREMLRGTNTSISTKGVNKNNWVFGSYKGTDKANAAGYDGKMTATLSINHVTTTGDTSHKGRLVIGQIHANNDEPIRLYYRKLPNNTNGSIYFAHEPREEDLNGNGEIDGNEKIDEIYVDIIGSRSSGQSNPVDGIPLNEKFTYSIEVVNNLLTVTLSREGKDDIVKDLDMSSSRFDEAGQ